MVIVILLKVSTVVRLGLQVTRKYAHFPRPPDKDKPIAQNLQVSAIYSFINLITNGLIWNVPLRDSSNNTK